jgi:hypothetical protein
MTWRPITEKPQSVGPCEINDVFGHTHQVQWDGRHFRWTEGQFAGNVMTHYNGDQWRSLDGNETKETEMLNEHDLEDMRPDAPQPSPEPEKCFRCGHAAHCGSCVNVAPRDESERSPLAKTYPRSED